MKILLICSKKFYNRIPPIKEELERNSNEVFLPNCFDDPLTEEKMWNLGEIMHQEFKEKMYKKSEETIKNMDAVLVLNYDKVTKEKLEKNYIGGATFLEMYDAFRFNKKIYLYNDIPEGILYDEIQGFAPIIINKDLSKVIK